MNYPLISEYVQSIKLAEENFDKLSRLSPVLDADGAPVMSSGNFAVVFKMQDGQTGKFYAVKCFLRDQEGRDESYRLIASELEYVSSTFLTPIRYLEKELFVDTTQSNETEFPVLQMDWVEGLTLDKYIRSHIADTYKLSLVTYQFCRMGAWLLGQEFAHGDLKPDNRPVRFHEPESHALRRGAYNVRGCGKNRKQANQRFGTEVHQRFGDSSLLRHCGCRLWAGSLFRLERRTRRPRLCIARDNPFRKIVTREEVRTRKGTSIKEVEKVQWIEARHDGRWTHVHKAFDKVKTLLNQWMEKHEGKDCYPPTVINITDGEFNGAGKNTVLQQANELKSMFTNDGNVLLFNIHISPSKTDCVILPISKDEVSHNAYSTTLYELSSLLPMKYNAEISRIRQDSDTASRHTAMAVNADMTTLIKLMDIGTPTNISQQ